MQTSMTGVASSRKVAETAYRLIRGQQWRIALGGTGDVTVLIVVSCGHDFQKNPSERSYKDHVHSLSIQLE
jgi:hypothetical protein